MPVTNTVIRVQPENGTVVRWITQTNQAGVRNDHRVGVLIQDEYCWILAASTPGDRTTWGNWAGTTPFVMMIKEKGPVLLDNRTIVAIVCTAAGRVPHHAVFLSVWHVLAYEFMVLRKAWTELYYLSKFTEWSKSWMHNRLDAVQLFCWDT
jgi:hypothetical protein